MILEIKRMQEYESQIENQRREFLKTFNTYNTTDNFVPFPSSNNVKKDEVFFFQSLFLLKLYIRKRKKREEGRSL